MNVLFLSNWYPDPPNNGSKLRIFNLLRGLGEQHAVTLLSFAQPDELDRPVGRLKDMCAEVHTLPSPLYTLGRPVAWRGLFARQPRHVVETYSPAMAARLTSLLQSKRYHLIIASELGTAAYAPLFQGVPALLEDVEAGIADSKVAQAPTALQRLRHRLTRVKFRAYLADLLRHFRACTVVSEQERSLVARMAPHYPHIEVVPNGVRLAEYSSVQATPEPGRLLFAGSFRYFANHDAMIWFLREVFPRIQAQAPDARLTITGDHANLPLPAAAHVTLAGFVEDVRVPMASAWVNLAPIRLGGGTRLKILEAMALRSPVVATSKGAEGLALEPGTHLLIGDTPDAFAEAVVRLLRDADLHQHLVTNAYERVRQCYDWEVVLPRFLQLAEHVAQV